MHLITFYYICLAKARSLFETLKPGRLRNINAKQHEYNRKIKTTCR